MLECDFTYTVKTFVKRHLDASKMLKTQTWMARMSKTNLVSECSDLLAYNDPAPT
jgi:hypothetical protein